MPRTELQHPIEVGERRCEAVPALADDGAQDQDFAVRAIKVPPRRQGGLSVAVVARVGLGSAQSEVASGQGQGQRQVLGIRRQLGAQATQLLRQCAVRSPEALDHHLFARGPVGFRDRRERRRQRWEG